MRRLRSAIAFAALAACGGGGEQAPPPNRAEDLYVRTGGNDANSGLTAAEALRQVATAADRSTPGDRIVVGPGVYTPVNIKNEGTAAQPITFLADAAGTLTGDAAGEVVLDAAGAEAAFKVSNKSYIIIDGFTATGSAAGNTAGVLVKSSASHVTIRNCIARGNGGQGIRTADATDVTIANNLVLDNDGFGIQVLGQVTENQPQSLRVRVYNNTVFANGSGGITVGSSVRPARDTFFVNNIIDGNSNAGFGVFTDPPSSLDGLVERYNLNNDGYAGVSMNPLSFSADPRFRLPPADFRLDQLPEQMTTSPAVDAGDPATPADIVEQVAARTTATSGVADSGRVDLGYHYPR